MSENLQPILEEQKAYYRARAKEYDQWFYRRGRYDLGPAHTKQWEAEAGEVRRALTEVNLTGHVLDMAAGTGIWTQDLVQTAEHVTALDSSREMIELNRQRVQSSNVTYTVADLFYWQPVIAYDAVFMGFWLSHVPPAQLYEFIGTMVGALKSGGKIFFVDSLMEPSATAKDSAEEISGRKAADRLSSNDYVTMRRRLNDGREFQIVKVYYMPDDLADRFKTFNIDLVIKQTDNFFIYGWGAKEDG